MKFPSVYRGGMACGNVFFKGIKKLRGYSPRSLKLYNFYFLLRYATKPNANAPKIAVYVAGSGTLIEMDKSFPLTA